jgi:hypothetical protein
MVRARSRWLDRNSIREGKARQAEPAQPANPPERGGKSVCQTQWLMEDFEREGERGEALKLPLLLLRLEWG